ncbi:MAG: hypothetical protein WA632_09880 [Gallionella sp.]
MNRHDEEFEQRVRTALESGMSAPDADTRRRLAAGRARALEQKPFLTRWLSVGNWIPATALAGCAVLAVALFIADRQPDAPLQIAQSDSEFALELLFSDGIADTEDDPDFYAAMDAMIYEEEQHAG